MPSLFDRRFKATGLPQLLNQCGEDVVYYSAKGWVRAFTAIVERNPPAVYNAAGDVVIPSFTIRATADGTIGVLPHEVDTGGDEVDVLEHPHDTIRKRCSVMQMTSQDSNVTGLVLR